MHTFAGNASQIFIHHVANIAIQLNKSKRIIHDLKLYHIIADIYIKSAKSTSMWNESTEVLCRK